MKSIAAIPTTYAGVRFRSRLEARWASFFDLCGWRWDYEPLDLDGYIPDFMLWLKKPILVEVKPLIWDGSVEEAQIIKSAETKIRYSGATHEALLLGARVGSATPDWFLGALNFGDFSAEGDWYAFGDKAVSFKCEMCGNYSFRSDNNSWHCRVSGCYDSTSHLGEWNAEADFKRAGNAAQWKSVR